MQITYYQRKPTLGQYSIEGIFKSIKRAMPSDVCIKTAISRYYGTNPLKLLYNIIEARYRQGDINHITGDIHYIACALDQKKTILTILDIVSIHRLNGVKRALLKYMWYDMPIKRSKIITVISKHTAQEVISIAPHAQGKIRVVYCPVSPLFVPAPKSFNGEKPVVLHIGTIQHKNLERLIEALSGISCHLDIIGKLSPTQQALLQEHNICYTNSYNLSDQEVVSKYQSCDMVAFVSTYEGFGMPIIEANATGRPVLTSNVCSMPEVAGDAACIIDPYDISSIRSGIVRIIADADYRNELVENGWRNAQRFSAEEIAKQYLEIYRELLR